MCTKSAWSKGFPHSGWIFFSRHPNHSRNRSQPADFGFPAGSRRRTAGLRREEMAQIVGISTTWYTWIEQGREVNISAEALDRLAGNLRLTRSERAYLFEIADRRDPQGSNRKTTTFRRCSSSCFPT